MSDKREPWRPTIPPKANNVAVGVNKPSEAIRGAAQHAFNNRPTASPNTSSTVKPLSSGARSAAIAAGSLRKPATASISEQNATNTTTASFAAYSRGRPPPGVEGQSSNAGLLGKPTLSSTGQLQTRSGASPEGSAQQAARMASRSPARRIAYSPGLQDKTSLPQDQSALLAGKIASFRSHMDAPVTSSKQSQTSTPQVEPPTLNMKQIPYLPRKAPEKLEPDLLAGKLAGAAAVQAAAKHAQAQVLAISPHKQASHEYFSLSDAESTSPGKSIVTDSPESVSAKSIFRSAGEGEESSTVDAVNRNAITQPRSASIPTTSTQRMSPGAMASANAAKITDYRSGLTERSLADAIMAGSLASSRAPSPTKGDVSLTASRHSRSHSHSGLSLLPHHFAHHERVSDPSTKTSHASPRSLKYTLRKHSHHKDDDEEETTKRGRKHFMRKHPHKHHEGDRRRWRDKVTERERRRYEGVWAANRGLLTIWQEEPALGESWKRAPEYDLVINVVVRDIWERSRLPKDVLEEIWDLVATSEDAQALQRDQFVVGLWLIDQRLKGRKLPVRVSSDVWNSVRHTQGVKISTKPY